jgi:hypothetical protein
MRATLRRSLCLLLALLCVVSVCAVAAADDSRYPAGQYFEADTGLTKGFTVQVSSADDLQSAEARRDAMLALGYDSYIYHVDGKYRTMCGKFRTTEGAKQYRDHICAHTDRTGAYLTNVYLPDWAYTEFGKLFQTDPINTQGQPYANPEQTTGPFYDGDGAGDTRTVYTVQLSSGNKVTREEEHRDALIAQGFDAFVYRRGGGYMTMSGMFASAEEAERYCSALKTYTDEPEAAVAQAVIPTSYVNLQTWESREQYYGKYVQLLQDHKWARSFLGDDRAAALIEGEKKGELLQYGYAVFDLDANGIDELILLDCVKTGRGAWAVISCDKEGEPYLIAWGYPSGQPVISACREQGVLAMQAHVNGVNSCEIYSLAEGKLLTAKVASSAGTETERVLPAQVDASVKGYYVELTLYALDDLRRLTGSGPRDPADPTVPAAPVTPATPAPSAAPDASPAPAPTVTPAPSPTPTPAPTPTPTPVVQDFSRDGVLAAARAAAKSNSRYSLVSDKNVELQVPAESDFLKTPFPMKTNAKENGRAIYIIPRPKSGYGTLGTVAHGEQVTILAETTYYYFFITQDGRAGWNGKSYFTEP